MQCVWVSTLINYIVVNMSLKLLWFWHGIDRKHLPSKVFPGSDSFTEDETL